MLLRNLNTNDQSSSTTLSDLDDGLPTIHAFARLCGRSISMDVEPVESLGKAAQALLASSKRKGSFEIRGNNNAFASPERLLAVSIQVEEDRYLVFRDKSNPRTTVYFLDAFRELCQSGLILHHTQRDFSLSHNGFQLADQLDPADYSSLIDFASEVEH